ncbi:hypothetical protein [Anaeromicrobium sediminis]|uniref:hypothetical protein n=1 Tax=Anaeromicrobium sediminis TaxID=1478221 RepID=UPI0026B467CA|nr:hypothetical protein [Anaeromicrobium sediminis]
MYYHPMYFPGPMGSNNKTSYILDFKEGDVNGDGVIDYVYLIGDKPYGDESPFRDKIRLKIVDGKTNLVTIIKLKENAGYNPTLFLGDFSVDKIDDILISIDSGGSGGYAFYYIYSFLKNEPKIIFDFEKFNEAYEYEVKYQDNYKVEVISKRTNTKYILDITYKGESYLSEIYYENGKLKEPIEGWVNPLGGLYPIDYQRDGTYELYAQQRIAGRYNADGLGYVQTSLEWNGQNFVPFFQTVGIFGGELNQTDENLCGVDFSNVKPMYSEKVKDPKLEDAFAKIFGLEKGKDKVRYYYNRIDLDGDNVPETFVYLVGPSVCGTGGCSAAIFKDVDGEYELLSKFTLVNNPIIVSNNKTNGYKDLVMYVSGGGIEAFCGEMKFDGTKYPQNPSLQPKLKPGTKVEGVAIIADDITRSPGIPF